MSDSRFKSRMPTATEALPGRTEAITVDVNHFVRSSRLLPPYPDGMEMAIFGLGCFWGAERVFWEMPGVYSTAVGYAGGLTPNPTYEEVCTGQTGHNEVVRVIFDPERASYDNLLCRFWAAHDPTQGMAQGNDRGTQYRSGIYAYDDEQLVQAEASRTRYQQQLSASGLDVITTEIMPVPEFYFAEGYHQQYLAKNPRGYCGIGGTGISCPAADEDT